ncbi:YncE family protein [Marinobacter lipolyticus]|uniref:YncE family protein n=1 Tax=Marinobacter lipolyticus TaxID=209639 RepID=UPI003A8CB176
MRLIAPLTPFFMALILSGCMGESESAGDKDIDTLAQNPTEQTQPDNEPLATIPVEDGAKPVVFVGSNWDGAIDVIDGQSYVKIGRINGIPDKEERMNEIRLDPIKLAAFHGIALLIGEGHNQYVDDMYSTRNGELLIVSRPSFADVVAIDIASNDIVWRFEVEGIRSDHMALSPDGSEVAVSASTGNVVHILDVWTGEEKARFPTGNSPHENVYSKDGKKIYHASIGHVFSPADRGALTDTKGERIFKVVDTDTWEDIKSFDISEKLAEAGYPDMSPAIRPMAHTEDEKFFYFQLSFFHGFVEYDMENDQITRVANLPNLVPDLPVELYVNDSAHHGISMGADDEKLCVAGTMSDYVAIVDRKTFEYELLEGLGEKPYWITRDISGENCFVSWSGTDQMSVINIDRAEEVVRVDVGDHPQRIREGSVPDGWTAAF